MRNARRVLSDELFLLVLLLLAAQKEKNVIELNLLFYKTCYILFTFPELVR